MQKYQAGQTDPADPSSDPNEGQAQHNTMDPNQERIMYQQEGVDQEVIQPGEHMQFVDDNQGER